MYKQLTTGQHHSILEKKILQHLEQHKTRCNKCWLTVSRILHTTQARWKLNMQR